MRIEHLVGITALAAVLAAGNAAAQGANAPTANYWVTADTSLSAMGATPGGGGGVSHGLILQLASGRVVAGEPSADHAPPAALGVGPRLPLTTPKTVRPPASGGTTSGGSGQVLVYWGCGDQARPGQPMTIDLSRPGAGSAGLTASLGPFLPIPPSPGPGRTYGEWTDGRAGQLGPRASLVGEHLVRGGYTPDIRFSLASGQDFMPPLRLSGTARDGAGATPLRWGAAEGAGGYFVSAVGASESGDAVIWTSSEIPVLAGLVPDHLSPADLKRLIARKVVLGPGASGCTIPAKVAQAAPALMLRVVALGGEVDFVSPPRPADPKAAWKPDYAVKVRYASIASAMLGLDEPADEEDADATDSDAAAASPPGEGVRTLFKGLAAIGR